MPITITADERKERVSDSISAKPLDPLIPPPVDYAPVRSESLGSRAVRNSLWTVGSYATLNVIRLIGNLIITHYLAQQLIGVGALVTTVIVGIRLFSDVGIGPAVVGNPRGAEEPFLRTAYAMQLLRGLCIWLVACLLAYPVGWWFATHRDEIYWALAILLPVAGLQALVEGFRSTAVFRLQRQLDLRKIAVLDVIEISITTTLMIVWARLSPTVWALVVPALLGTSCMVVLSHFLLRDRVDRPQWDPGCARELMKIGRWIVLSTALTFLATQFAPLIFGTLVDPATLAVYWIALNLATTPFTAIYKLGTTVLFPTFSRVVTDADRFADLYGRARTLLLMIGGLFVCGMIASSPFAIRMLYKPEYDGAAVMLQLMALSVWFQIIDTINVAGLLARQHAGWLVVGSVTKVVFMFGLVPVVFHYWGFSAAIVALGVADLLRAGIGVYALTSNGMPWRCLRADFLLPPLIAVLGLAGYAVTMRLAPGVESHFPPTKWGRRGANAVLFATAGAQVLAVFVPLTIAVWKKSRRAALIEK